jgi:hypothetical protein
MDNRTSNENGPLYGFGARAQIAVSTVRRRNQKILSLLAAALSVAVVVLLVTSLPADPATAMSSVTHLIN